MGTGTFQLNIWRRQICCSESGVAKEGSEELSLKRIEDAQLGTELQTIVVFCYMAHSNAGEMLESHQK